MKNTIKEIAEALRSMEDDKDPRIHVWEQDDRKGVNRLIKSFRTRLERVQKEHERFIDMTAFEMSARENGYKLIAGIDEVGRGPLAGPVVAAAVVLPDAFYLPGLDDSKKLSNTKKLELYETIQQRALGIGVGFASAKEIDDVNIYQATKLAMLRALGEMKVSPDMLLIDAMTLDIGIEQQSIIKGDARSVSIAAASVIAKVTRDRFMTELAKQYPYYRFEQNVGYGTKEHLEGLKQHGPIKEHRFSFEPIKSFKNE
ncbi:ribonuclease HII [Jeotgalibacillus soli]|uniref:Ribonuclease HII n=1 Tax=Jeotgalibacillus soli TaxID=889306 RepID=A0A0C2VLI9_9BACL|nr:ribonuclease H [Jeotgalibacillus soli]